MGVEVSAKATDIEKLRDKMNDYTPMALVREIIEDVKNTPKKEDLDIVLRELEFMKRDFDMMCTKEELITRLNVFNSDLNTKL